METKKERFIKILKRFLIGLSIGLNVFFLIAIIIGGASVKKTNKLNKVDNVSENVNFIKENKRLVSYDDEDYSVTFSINELNNYTFVNLSQYLVDNSTTLTDSFDPTTIFSPSSSETSWTLESFGEQSIEYVSVSQDVIDFNIIQNKWEYYSDSESDYIAFVNDVKWYLADLDEGDYLGIKQAIVLDIQANSGTMTDGIFETLTESTVSFIGTLGSGIVAMTSVFYDSANSQLTTIGLLSVIVVAVSLSYFLFRLIIGLIRMRG